MGRSILQRWLPSLGKGQMQWHNCSPVGIFLGAVVSRVLFCFVFMNSLSSAKGASRGQFSASVPAETWKSGNWCQAARWAVLEAAETRRSWPVSRLLWVRGERGVVSAATMQNSERGCGALGGQAFCEDRVCAHCKPASKISTIQGGKPNLTS